MDKKEFSTFDVAKILGIGRSRLVHWWRDGFIPRGKYVKWGRGYKTSFSLFDLYSIALFMICMDFSLSRKFSKNAWKDIKWSKVGERDYLLLNISKSPITFEVDLKDLIRRTENCIKDA